MLINHASGHLSLVIGLFTFLSSPADLGSMHTYDDLTTIFEEFRDFQVAKVVDGVPDYTIAGMQAQYKGLQEFRNRLAAIDSSDWPVSQQVDYHLVRAEMNALEFFHKVHKPWARDPGFYSMIGGDAGAVMNTGDFFAPLLEYAESVLMASFTGRDLSDLGFSVTDSEQSELQSALRAIPELYRQAKGNLTEAVHDFAVFAIRNFEMEIELYETLAKTFELDFPGLAKDSATAANAVRDYVQWLDDNKNDMVEKAGLGKDNYDWWLRNVQLSPWGWDDNNRIIQQEYNRAITFLKLEEHRNRDLLPLEVAMTDRAYHTSLRQAMHYVTDFLKNEGLMTIDDWVDPSDYYLWRGGEWPERLKDIDDSPHPRYLPENSNVDLKYRQREILPGETHEFIGHLLDDQRQEHLPLSAIRKADRRFNMASMRLEGWAVSLEELLVQAGILDERPQKGREMLYIMLASHMSLAIPDMKMQANEINLAEARQLCADIMPRGWTRPEEDVVYFEMQSNLRNPGGFHSNVVTGKAYFMKLFREEAQRLGDDFVIKDFVDEFLSSGLIPIPLIRWEMTGNSDDILLETQGL